MNQLFYGDNLAILRKHVKDDSVDLIYIDPPFNSKRDYNVIYDGATAQTKAFGDTWSLVGVQELEQLIYKAEPQRYHYLHSFLDGMKKILFHSPNAVDKSMYAYLINMGVRIVEMHRTLKETGSLYLHCDPTASHYLKILLDAVFGRSNFRNEIVWHYRRWTGNANGFLKMHDTVFFYGKNYKVMKFNSQFTEYTEKSLKRKQNYHTRIKGDDVYETSINERGVKQNDVWIIPVINSQAKERLGYPTQKPEALLERIIKASCPKGGVVLDAYCGCGTTIAVAQRLGMKWIGIDITYLAIDLIQQRIIDHFYLEGIENPSKAQQEKAKTKFYKDADIFGIPRDLESAKKLARETKGDYVRKEFEKWAVFSVGGVYSEKKGADGGVDGYFYINDADKKGISKKQCFIQVKSGKIGVKDIRDFDSTLNSLSSPIGIFIAFADEITKNMRDYILTLPKYSSMSGSLMQGRIYPKITIISIDDILAENVPEFAVRATRSAENLSNKPTNGDLFLDQDDE